MRIQILFMLLIFTIGRAVAAEASTELRGFHCENHMYRKSIVNLDGSNLSFEDSWMQSSTEELKNQIQRKIGNAEILTISEIGISMKTDPLTCDRSKLANFQCSLIGQSTLARLSLRVLASEKKFGQEHFLDSKLVIPVRIQKLGLAIEKLESGFVDEAQFHADISLQLEEDWQPVHLEWDTFFYLKGNSFSSCRTW